MIAETVTGTVVRRLAIEGRRVAWSRFLAICDPESVSVVKDGDLDCVGREPHGGLDNDMLVTTIGGIQDVVFSRDGTRLIIAGV